MYHHEHGVISSHTCDAADEEAGEADGVERSTVAGAGGSGGVRSIVVEKFLQCRGCGIIKASKSKAKKPLLRCSCNDGKQHSNWEHAAPRRREHKTLDSADGITDFVSF